jgi:hypothetical protein
MDMKKKNLCRMHEQRKGKTQKKEFLSLKYRSNRQASSQTIASD